MALARQLGTAILVAHLIYATAFMARSSFVVDGQRYFCLLDDAMISMRYARHLASGVGWVWNPGEQPVEGYTNPLWCLLMAAVHLLPLPLSKTSLVVQMLGEACLLLNLLLTYRLARLVAEPRLALMAVALTAWYFPLDQWALQGMEVGALAACVSASMWALLRWNEGKVSAAGWLAPGCVAMALRPDGIVLHLTATVLACIVEKRHRGRVLAASAGCVLAVAGGWTLFRYFYYGDWLPNTYYLKMTGFPAVLRVARGAFQAAIFWAQFAWPLVVSGVALLVVAPRRSAHLLRFLWRRSGLALTLMAVMVAAHTAYSIYVGGDAWERVTGANRFIAPAVPLAIIVGVLILSVLARLAPRRWQGVLLGSAVLGFWINANAYYGWTSLGQLVLLVDPPYKHDNVRNVQLARALEDFTAPGARIAIDYAGTAPYFLDRPMIDLLGKTDPIVARTPAHRRVLGLPAYREFYPGHLKWDYAHSIGQLRPDVVCAIWRRSLDDALRYLAGHYFAGQLYGVSIYVRKDSPLIRWELVPVPLRQVASARSEL